jgi:hypothetical protein
MNEKDKNFGDYQPERQFLEIGQPYWVQCKNISCLAVFNKDGKWKASYNGKELSDVINFFPIRTTNSSKLQTWSVIPV